MPFYRAYDDAELAYRELGDPASPPLVCLAGGPGRDAAYLGDLGGLDRTYRLIVPDARGTGDSPLPSDPGRYAFPSLAEDVESLREHLGLDRIAILAHDAAAATAQAYAASHPLRTGRLVLVAPGARLQGALPEDARRIFDARRGEAWWPDAAAAVEELARTTDFAAARALLPRVAPMAYGTWGPAQRAHAEAEPGQIRPVPRAGFWQGVDDHARIALLERVREAHCPALVVTGEHDAVAGIRSGELVAETFPGGDVLLMSGVGHYPWVDDPDAFADAVHAFLTGRL
ncbi:alpha/beta fold hydrolase [Streptomyces sp. NPDC060194]|uniref:alpha/beta fold hydrolase n=1 Tax=Streptomyces sp. NPDC060194 TaxID=3347069 RepID=UPI00365E96AC